MNKHRLYVHIEVKLFYARKEIGHQLGKTTVKMFRIEYDDGLFPVVMSQEAVVLVGENRRITSGITKNFLQSSGYYQRLLTGTDVLD